MIAECERLNPDLVWIDTGEWVWPSTLRTLRERGCFLVHHYTDALAARRRTVHFKRRLLHKTAELIQSQIDAMLESVAQRTLAREIPADYDVTMTYSSPTSRYAYPIREFNEKVIDRFNEGALFYTYVGHGYPLGFDRIRDGRSSGARCIGPRARPRCRCAEPRPRRPVGVSAGRERRSLREFGRSAAEAPSARPLDVPPRGRDRSGRRCGARVSNDADTNDDSMRSDAGRT